MVPACVTSLNLNHLDSDRVLLPCLLRVSSLPHSVTTIARIKHLERLHSQDTVVVCTHGGCIMVLEAALTGKRSALHDIWAFLKQISRILRPPRIFAIDTL